MEKEKEMIDECFFIEEKRWGTWDSQDKEGKKLITSLTRESCINATRFYLKGLQEGQFEETKSYTSTVEGKL
jgi:hypothetical protein